MIANLEKGDLAFGVMAAFLCGVFAAGMRWNAIALCVAPGIVISVLVSKTIKASVALYVFFICACVAGLLYYYAFAYWISAHTRIPEGKNTAFFATISEEPKPAGNYMLIIVGLSHPYAGTIDLFASPTSDFHYGDHVWITGDMASSRGSDNVGEPPSMFFPKIKLIAPHQGFFLTDIIIRIKAAIIKKFSSIFPQDEAALLGAIVIGTITPASPLLKTRMELSGTTYIVGMFGYKMAAAVSAIETMAKDRVSYWARAGAAIGVMAIIVFISGGNVSATRAAIMGSFSFLAKGWGRIFDPRNALALSITLMALWNPGILVDAGFQLSFLSFAGIFYLGPAINRLLHLRDPGFLRWREHVMLSLATNFAILPVAMNTFGDFSVTSLISNILIMLPWPIIMLFGIVAAITAAVGGISHALVFIVAWATKPFLWYELMIIKTFAFIFVPMPDIFRSPVAIVFYYGLMIIFIHYYGAPEKMD